MPTYLQTLKKTPLLHVGLIGNPVAHSYSPRMHQVAFDTLGIAAHYELWQTTLDDLSSRLASLLDANYLGANVTIPYKQDVLPLLDIVDPLATRLGAVNTIVHRNSYLYGYNTDAPGLLNALLEQGLGERYKQNRVSLKGYTVILLGAGGAARSAAFALASASVDRLIIINRNLERAQNLAAEVQQDLATVTKATASFTDIFSLSDPAFIIPHERSIIINATSVGMHGYDEEATPFPADILARFAPDTFVFDMIYNPIQTRLLCQARALGLQAVNGFPMLLHQGALAFTLWTGEEAPLEVMRRALI